MEMLVSTNPGKGYKINGRVEISSKKEIYEKIYLANSAKISWKELGVQERIKLIRPIYEDILARKEEFAQLITKEIGKPISSSRRETTGYIGMLEWFINNVEQSIKDEITHEDLESRHRIVYEPSGTAVSIAPWNYPLGMAIWGIFPNLLVGNTVVFKTSEECPLVGKLLEDVINSHYLPQGVFSEVYGAGYIGKNLIESDVDLIWFTGSSKVGKEIYKIAADKFVRSILEMGGSNPAIVFEDADLEKSISKIYTERFDNCGQSCDSLKRLLIHESIFDYVIEGLEMEMGKRIFGDPDEEKTEVGSLVAERQLVKLVNQFEDAISKGAKVIAGGKKPNNLCGAYFEPTLLTNINKNMKVWNEEVFGPILSVMPFKTEEEAINLANDTRYGLGSRIFTSDGKRATRVASKMESGTVEINMASRWLPCNPFGGYKESGIGREHGVMGFKELCQCKVISEDDFFK